MEKKTIYSKDTANKKMIVTRDFEAPVEQVWNAWTDSRLLDQWWAPQPWKAKTKTMNFTEGGFWHYAMVGPDGVEIWARIDYHTIIVYKYFTATDSFCDVDGVKSNEFPSMKWKNSFQKSDSGTRVEIEITFNSEADIEKIMEMGFEAGFAAAHENLDRLLKNIYQES